MSCRNLKKKIKGRFKENGYPVPSSYEVSLMVNWLDRTYGEGVLHTMDNLKIASIATGFSLAHTEPTQAVTQAEYLAGLKYMLTHAIEEKPMRDDFTVKTSASTINISPAASASVTQKTDLQNQREYLLDRLSDVKSSFRYGAIHGKMRDAFAIDIDNRPKTAKELIDGITSGKFTLDTKKMAVQDVVISTGNEVYDRDDDVYVFPRDPMYAMNWGGLSPDRVGYENAKIAFEAGIKAAADTIMIGEPTAALAAIQALEAWTPPAAAAN